MLYRWFEPRTRTRHSCFCTRRLISSAVVFVVDAVIIVVLAAVDAGVEARGGSSVHLSDCVVKECQKSGVFAQAFSRATLTRCDVIGNHFAGAEAMRCVA